MANYEISIYDGLNWIRLAQVDDINSPVTNKTLPPISRRDFEDGTLIKTDIDYSNDMGDAFYMEVKGDMYGYGSIFTAISGYIYNDHEGNPGPIIANRIVNHSSTCCIDTLKAMCIDGKLCFWWPRLGYWQSFSVVCYRSSEGDYFTNHVTEIFNSVDPSNQATKVFDMTSEGNAVVYPVTTDNISQQSVNYANSSDYASNAGNAYNLDGNPATAFARKIQWEWNEKKDFGDSGYLLIGKFSMYDSNVTIDINSTTDITYHATLVIATQNINESRGGSWSLTTYGDADNHITPLLKVKYASGSRYFEVYFAPPAWSKNLVHIKATGIYDATNICESVNSVPSTNLLTITNALTSSFVEFNSTQSLNSAQKSRARSNIGAGTVVSLSISGTTLYYNNADGSSGSVELPAGGASQVHNDNY